MIFVPISWLPALPEVVEEAALAASDAVGAGVQLHAQVHRPW